MSLDGLEEVVFAWLLLGKRGWVSPGAESADRGPGTSLCTFEPQAEENSSAGSRLDPWRISFNVPYCLHLQSAEPPGP